MKAYLITTGSIFALIVLIHLWRFLEEGAQLAGDPGFMFFTFAAAGMSLWSWRLLIRPRPARDAQSVASGADRP